MWRVEVAVFAFMFLLAGLPDAFGLEVTAPAFLWSSHGSSDFPVREVVDYRRVSPKDLAKSVLSAGGWSNVLCSGEIFNDNVDLAVVFIGNELQSSSISSPKQHNPLLDMLKHTFMSSNFSMAFPYVAILDEKDKLESTLISAFAENCESGLGLNRISYMDSCSVEGENLKRIQDLNSVQDLVDSRISGKTDLIVFCSEALKGIDEHQSEGEVLSNLISLLEQSSVKYTILYTSNPHRSIQYHPHLALRFLAEGTKSNFSASSSCDQVCQIKKSLLEGLFVGLVLLIILISGLCCMMGIETPTRFETPQDS